MFLIFKVLNCLALCSFLFRSSPQFFCHVSGFGLSAELEWQHVATKPWRNRSPLQHAHALKTRSSLSAHTTSNVKIPHPTCTKAAPQHPERFQHRQDLLESRHCGMSVASTYQPPLVVGLLANMNLCLVYVGKTPPGINMTGPRNGAPAWHIKNVLEHDGVMSLHATR